MIKIVKTTIEGDSPPIVDNDPGFDPRDYELLDDNTKKKKFTDIMQCIIDMGDFPSDSLMVEYITNEAWLTLTNVTTIMVDKVDNFRINKKDRSFKSKPMKLHLHKLQCILLFYDSKSCDMFGPLDEEDVLKIRETQFPTYCSSPEFQSVFANLNKPMVNLVKSIGVATPVDALTAQEFRRGVKRDMTPYKELKEDKQTFSADMHHMHLGLDADHSPTNASDVARFK
jgi:hypothetical protein